MPLPYPHLHLKVKEASAWGGGAIFYRGLFSVVFPGGFSVGSYFPWGVFTRGKRGQTPPTEKDKERKKKIPQYL